MKRDAFQCRGTERETPANGINREHDGVGDQDDEPQPTQCLKRAADFVPACALNEPGKQGKAENQENDACSFIHASASTLSSS